MTMQKLLSARNDSPDYRTVRFAPVINNAGHEKMKELHSSGKFVAGQRLQIDTINAADGGTLVTIPQLTASGFGTGLEDEATGSWILTGGHIQVAEELIPILGITYHVKMNQTVRVVIIERSGKAVLLAKSQDGSVDTLIREEDLRRIEFEEDGGAEIQERD